MTGRSRQRSGRPAGTPATPGTAPVLRLLALLLAASVGVGVAPPAGAGAVAPAADTCRPLELDDPRAVDVAEVRARAESATTVFVGEVAAVTSRDRRRPGSTPDAPGSSSPGADEPAGTTTWRHSVRVGYVFRGDLDRRRPVEVVTTEEGRDAVGRLRRGATYLFFAEGDPAAGPLTTTGCGAATRITGGLTSRLRDVLDAALQEPEPEPTPEVALAAPEGGSGDAPSLTRLAAPGVAVALIGLLGLALLARIGRRRP